MQKQKIILILFSTLFLVVATVWAADIVLTVTISDSTGKAAAILDDFAVATGWVATVVDPADSTKTIPNPITKRRHANDKVNFFVKEVVKAYRANNRAEKERQKAITESDAEVVVK